MTQTRQLGIACTLGLLAVATNAQTPTQLVDIEPGNGNPRNFTRSGNRVLFTAERGAGLREAWVTDGTVANTAMVQGIGAAAFDRPAFDYSDIGPFTVLRTLSGISVSGPGLAGFTPISTTALDADDEAFGDGLLVGDGSLLMIARLGVDGTLTPLEPYSPSFPVSLAEFPGVFGEYAFFTTSNGSNSTLFITDGTAAGTQSVPGFLPSGASMRRRSLGFDGRLWIIGSGLASTTGTEIETSTTFAPTTARVVATETRLWAYSMSLLFGGDSVEAFDPITGVVTSATFPQGVLSAVPFGERLLVTTDSILGGIDPELWITDGTQAGTIRLPTPTGNGTPAVVSRELAYVPIGSPGNQGLWRTDGTVAGTTLVASGSAISPTAVFGKVYFAFEDGDGESEPFVIDPEVVNMPFGAGCSGHTTGTTTIWSDVDPRIGRTITLRGRSRFDQTGTGTLAAFFCGQAAPNSIQLEATKCFFHLDLTQPIASLPASIDTNGDFSFVLQAPNDPSLVGLFAAFQAAVFPSPIGLDFSNGLLWKVGS